MRPHTIRILRCHDEEEDAYPSQSLRAEKCRDRNENTIRFVKFIMREEIALNLRVAPYRQQKPEWPRSGHHILAQYDDSSLVVYQAYHPSIGLFAAQNGYFGGGFSYNRMSWCKPNFLWMMYRSGWGTKPNQEITLAIRLKRAAFDGFLAQAVPSSHDPNLYKSRSEWSRMVQTSEVRLQWDPDHSPSGGPLERRAIQIGLRGSALRAYGREAILEIEDISAFVAEQRLNVGSPELLMPEERVYRPEEPSIAARVRLSDFPERPENGETMTDR